MNVEMTRRQLLKGVSLGAGASLLYPMLGQAAAHAAGDAKAVNRKRFVFVLQSNGMNPAHLVPVGVERKTPNGNPTATKFIDIPLGDKPLHKALEPLTPFRNRLTLVEGLSNRIAYSDHSCEFGALGCCPKGKPYGASIDLALADALPAPFKHVALGYSERSGDVYCYSAIGAGKPAPISTSPREAFKSLFGAVADAGGTAFDVRTKLLEFLADDVKRARAALAGEERQKLDSYVAAFETLHGRQGQLAGLRDAMKKHAPKLKDEVLTHEPNASQTLEAQFDIGAATLIAGMTNVVTLVSGGGGQGFGKFPELGVPNLHHIGHGGGYENMTYEDCFVAIRRVHAKLIADLAAKLAAVPEGDGTMLDNTVIVYLSDSGDSHHPSGYQWPVVLLGNLGGKLKSNGRFVEYPNYHTRGHRTLAAMYCTLLHAAGAPRDKFGVDDVKVAPADQKGPLTELLA